MGVRTRAMRAGGAVFAVTCPSADAAARVERLLIDLPDAEGGDLADIRIDEFEPGLYDVVVDGVRRFPVQDATTVLSTLLGALNRLVLDSEPDRLHIHAAVLERDRHGVIVSAPTGTGKTTLSAALALDGWSYLSDEMASFVPGSSRALSFLKPLIVKPGGETLVPSLRPSAVTFDDHPRSWWTVPPSSLPAPGVDAAEVMTVVLLQNPDDRIVDRPSIAWKVHPADAVVALMNQTMDSSRFGPRSLDALVHVAANANCSAMTVGMLETSVETVNEMSRRRVDATPYRALKPSGSLGSWRVGSEVRSFVIGDRAVVHNTFHGTIVALDEAGSAAWLAMHGERPSWMSEAMLVEASYQEFFGRLAALALVEADMSVSGSRP